MKLRIVTLLFVLGLFLTGCGQPKKDIDCLLDIPEVCVTKIAKTPSIDGNYWEGSRVFCKGESNMPTAIDLAKIVAFVYEGNPRIPADEGKNQLKKNPINYKFFDVYKNGYYSIFSNETEEAKKYAYIRTFYDTQTEWTSISSQAGVSVVTVCVKHK